VNPHSQSLLIIEVNFNHF